MMICGHCGSEVKDGFTVCASCGANLRRNFGVWTLGLAFILTLAGADALSRISDNVIGAILGAALGWGLAVFVLYRGWQKRWYRRND